MPVGITTPPLTLETLADSINRNLSSIDRNVWERAPAEYTELAKVESTTRWVDEHLTVQGLSKPRENRDLEPLPQVAPVRGNKTVIRQRTYRSQLTVEETAMRVSEHKALFDNVEDLIESFKTLKDQVVADFFNNGFTDALAQNITESDGTARAFFSTGHAYEDGAGTFSNYLNVGVPPNIDTVYMVINQMLRRLKDQAGNFINMGGTYTIVTPTLNPSFGVAADEIIQSVDRPDTTNRATNILKSLRLRHVSLNNLTSSTKWFILPSTSGRNYPLVMKEMRAREITPLEKIGPINPHAMVMTGRAQFGVGFVGSYRGSVAIGT